MFINNQGQLTSSDFVEYKKYDINSNPQVVTNKAGITTSYLWDYRSQYPVAEFIGANQPDIAYTSFESNSTGNWMANGNRVADNTAPTGRKSFQLGNLQRTGLSASATYILTYWAKAGSTVNVSGGTFTDITSEPLSSGWAFHSRKIASASAITISGTGYIDEVRIHPVNARVTTHTYDPLIGQTSVTDPNNITTYYLYDGLGRLSLVKNRKGSIVKRIEYNYYNK